MGRQQSRYMQRVFEDPKFNDEGSKMEVDPEYSNYYEGGSRSNSFHGMQPQKSARVRSRAGSIADDRNENNMTNRSSMVR
jgi:hypothetical protein